MRSAKLLNQARQTGQRFPASSACSVHTHLTYGLPSPHQGHGQHRISPADASFPRPIYLVTWLPHQLSDPTLGSFLGETWAPYPEGQRERKRRAAAEWCAVVLTSKGPHQQACLGHCKRKGSPNLPAIILTVYTEALMGFSHMYHPDGLTTPYSLQFASLKRAPTVGSEGRAYIKDRGSREAPVITRVHLEGQPVVTFSQ